VVPKPGDPHPARLRFVRHNPAVPDDAVSKEELRSAIEARRELGEEMEPAVIDAFVARIEQRIAARDDQSERALERKRDHQKEMVLGSMAIAIPMLAIAAVFTGLAGVIAVCVALAVIAIVTAR
jgi:VIT1/CCC1 family predicted Fe2+/Mn2+ transporter